MRLSPAHGFVALVFAATLSVPFPARAWTRSVVQSARATVEVEHDAGLYVLLRLDIEVHAGWLHELELVDLGPGIELDRYRPPYLRSDEGEVFRPEAELHEDGRIRLWFPRREAPRRGEYRVFMRYRTRADARAVEVRGEPRARIVWSVPTWETGLHNVTVEFRAPKGTVVPDETQEPPPGVSFEVMERPERTVMRWRRIHLPRMTAWPIELDAPASSIKLPVENQERPRAEGFRPLAEPAERQVPWALFLIAALSLLKRRSIERRIGRQGLGVRASWPVVGGVCAAILLVASWLGPTEAAWAVPVIALALHRPFRPSAPIAPANWQNVSFAALTARRPPDLLDGTTPLGVALLLVCLSTLFAVGQVAGALLLLPIFLSGTRHHFPQSTVEGIEALRDFASDLRLEGDAPPMCFRWQQADEGSTRLLIDLPSSRPGLLSLSFVPTSTAWGYLRRKDVMLLAQTRAQSDADDLMRRRTGSAESVRAPDGSILRLVAWDTDAVELLRVLARKTPKAAKISRGTWLLREITEPGRRAA